MFYPITIIISIILWIWFFYIKNTREYYGEPITAPVWAYLIAFIFLFVPIFNFTLPFIFTLLMICDKDLKLKNGKTSIGEKIKDILTKEF